MIINPSYAQIVPDPLQAELIQLGEAETSICWRLGDITAETLDYCRMNKIVCTREEVYSAVAAFCGKRSRTVREYCYLAQFYPPEWRAQYGILKIDHFRTAALLGERAIDALEWAVGQVEVLNRPATVDAMWLQFNQPILENAAPPPTPSYQGSMFSETSETQGEPPEAAYSGKPSIILNTTRALTIRSYSQNLEGLEAALLAPDLKVPSEYQDRLRIAFWDLRALLAEIRSHIDLEEAATPLLLNASIDS